MEHVGAICEGLWMNSMCSDEADFMAQLLGSSSLPTELPIASAFWQPSLDVEGSLNSSDEANNDSMYSGGSSSIPFPFYSCESYYPNVPHQIFVANSNVMAMDNHMIVMGGDEFLNQDVSNDSTESNDKSDDVVQGNHLQPTMQLAIPMPDSRKRSRVSGEVQRNKRNMKLKCPKLDDDNHNDNHNRVSHGQSSSSYCSEDESNASHEINGVTSSSSSKGSGAPNSNGKTRTGRGSVATDPQSLYARKRRERINERLRILQNLVPNGTKVDISTMLEEAVQYVKFLQLQIKLLSSDDLWMYAPIAYNGMDIGLDLKIFTPKPQS